MKSERQNNKPLHDMMTLVSNTKFGIELSKNPKCFGAEFERLRKVYDQLMWQDLHFGLFVPCDENGIVYYNSFDVRPNADDYTDKPDGSTLFITHLEDYYKYQKAKSQVLFDGFFWHAYGFVYNKDLHQFDQEFFEGKKVEHLLKYNLPLSEHAIGKIKLLDEFN